MRKINQPKSMKEASKITKNNNDLNIPLYNDEKVNEEIKRREMVIKTEEENKKKAKEKELEKEQRKLLNPISNIDGLLLITCSLLIIFITVSLTLGEFLYAVYTIISILGTIFVGKRLQLNSNKLLNVLLWNITQSIRDFIDYKVPYNLLSNSDFRLFKVSVIFSIVSVVMPSYNIVFSIMFVLTISMFIASFANRQTEDIGKNARLIAIFCFIGLIVKTILTLIICKTLFIDFTHVVLINLFVSINFYAGRIEITEPKIDNINNN